MSYPNTTFPTTVDTPTNPGASSDTSVFDHAGLHAFENNAIAAIEAKVGADASADTNSHDYKLSSITGTSKAVSSDLSNMPHGSTTTYGIVKTSTSTDTVVSSDDTRIPSVGQGQALSGSQGIPSTTNPYVTLDNVYTGIYDQTQTTQNLALEFGTADTTSNKNIIAQSFIPSKTKLSGVLLYKLANTGTYTGNVIVSIQADASGFPSGVNLATTTISNATYNGYSVGEFTVNFSSEISITSGSTYWIIVSSSTSDTANHPNIGVNSSGGYANGFVKYKNITDGWVSISGYDLYFKTVQGTIGQIASGITTILKYTSPGTYTFTKPTGVKKIFIQLWGAGGSGAVTAGGGTTGIGGGGGGYVEALVEPSSVSSSTTITIGTGGASVTSSGTGIGGNAGGNSSFGSLLSANGGGGGILAGGTNGGTNSIADAVRYGGNGGGQGLSGSNSVFAGGGGGSGTGTGGTSVFAGNGGAGAVSGTASDGSYPGGGGGSVASNVAGTSGKGANGQAIITVFY